MWGHFKAHYLKSINNKKCNTGILHVSKVRRKCLYLQTKQKLLKRNFSLPMRRKVFFSPRERFELFGL